MGAFRQLLFLIAAFAPLAAPAPAAAQAYDQLLAACRSFDVPDAQAAAACQQLGNDTRKGENEPGKVIDWPRALWFHDRACTRGGAAGCISTGQLYVDGKVGVPGNASRANDPGAFTYYRRACELSADTCFVEAVMHERGRGTAKNLAVADSLYARACTADKGGCGFWADFMLRRTDAKPDLARVAGLYRSACDPGREARACAALAGLIEKGQIVAAAPGEAAKLRQSACNLDKAQCQPGTALAAGKPAAAAPSKPASAPAPTAAPTKKPAPAPVPAPAAAPAKKPDVFEECNKSTDKLAAAKACEIIAITLEMDMGGGSDHAGAGQMFHRACSLGLGSACRSLGTKFSFGEIGATGNPKVPNHKLAVLNFRKACDLDPAECSWLGGSFEHGEGVAKDLAEAQRLYDKSCAANDNRGCYYAARIMETRGNGTPAQVFQLYLQSCDLDDNQGCAEASRRYERGIGTKVDKAKAAKLRTKACGMDYFKSLDEGFCPKEPAKAPAKPRT